MKHSTNLNRILLVVALLAVVSLSCAKAETSEDQLVIDGVEKLANGELAATLAKYYEAERRKDWIVTYQARTPAYRDVIPFEHYRKSMDDGMADWKLKKIEILESVISKNGETLVKIRFHDEFGAQAAQFYFAGRVSHGTATRIESTSWKQVSGRWLCIDAGQRVHLPLNGQMVYE